MPISSELFSALEKGGGLSVEKTPSADKPAPQGGGSTFDRLLRQESGGRQTDKNGNVITSSKGAIGIAQVMPATGPEAAKLAGMEWDPVRFKSDAEYNKALGRAYFDKQLSVFGDERLALAAYNAGPGAVRLAIARSAKNGGDPLEYLPLETQKYVPAILGADSGVKPKGPKWADDKAIVRDDGRPGAIAKSDAVRAGPTAGDMAKAFGASALSGVGDMGQGLIGEPLAWLANKAAGTEEFEGQNLLAGVAESIRDDMTEGGKIARQDVPSGDVFQPETWKLPETTGGMLMIGADGLGSLVPSILPFVGQAGKAANLAKAAQAAKVAGDFEKASQLAIQAERASRVAKGAGAVGGFAMTGGAAAGEVRQNIERELQGKSHEELIQAVPLYREAFNKTGDARMARQAVANGAAQYATLFAGAMGAVGGGINAKLLEDVIVKRGLSAALGKMSGNAAVRAGVGAGAGAAGEGLQEVSEKMGQNAGENVGMGRPIADNVTRDSFGDFIGGAMIGGPMGGVGGGASLQVKQPVQPVIKQNSPLSNMASVGQAAQANAEQASAQVAPEQAGAAVPGVNTPAQDPTADRLAAMQSFVEDKAFIQALRGTEGYGPESVTELLSAYAKARNPNIDPRLRERALSDLEKFVETFNNRPNFVFGKNTQEPTPQPGQSVAPYQQQGGAVGPAIRRPDGRTLDGEIITRPEGMAGANPNQLKAPPVLGLPTEEALQAKRQADADYEQAYQDLVKAEQLGANEAETADYQRTLLEAERLRDELAAQLADSDARVADSQQREAEARRRDILGSVIEQGISGVNPVADVANRFSAELMRQGYRDTAPTDAETQSILRAVDVANAREDGPLPSLPNEGDFYAPPKAQRTAPPKAEPKPKQQPNRRLTPKEIREYVAAGAILNGDTLTLPDGTVLKLKGPQIAAAREAMRKAAPQAEKVVQESRDDLIDRYKQAEPFSDEEYEIYEQLTQLTVEAIEAKLDAGSVPVFDTGRDTFVAVTPSAQQPGKIQVTRYNKDGVFGDTQYDAMKRAVIDNDLYRHRALTPEEAESRFAESLQAEAEYQARKSQAEAPAQPAETIDVSTRTDDQLHYLANNGKPGWKEAAQAEMARRELNRSESASKVRNENEGTIRGAGAEAAAKGLPREVPAFLSGRDSKALWLGGYDSAKPEIRSDLDAAAHEAATSPLNDTPQPTDGQKSAGNYKVGKVRVQGMDISIENPKGSKRSGVSPDGRKWESTLHAHYGYFTGTKAADGDHLDVYLTDGAEDAPMVWVIDQKNADGTFDEHKTLLGPRAEEEAKAAYLANYEPGWDGIGAISSMPIEAFKAWAFDGKKKRKPLVYVEPEAPATEASDTATAQPDPREAYANQKERAYVAKRGGVVPPKAAMAVRIGAYREYDREKARPNPLDVPGDDVTASADRAVDALSESEAKAVAERLGKKPGRDPYATIKAEHPDDIARAIAGDAWINGKWIPAQQPTHQDPGQPSEPVTPAVVAKSIQKSARNTEFNPAEAKKWLLGEIDKAVANVPAENAELAAELVRFVTFDVPGDGKFKVMNTVDGLNAFRSKVEKSPGFARPTAPRAGRSMPGGPSLDESIADAKKNGGSVLSEIGNAIEIARLRGKEDDTLLDRFKENSGGKSYDEWRAEQGAEEEIAAREEAERNRQPSEEESAEFMRSLMELHGQPKNEYKFTRDTIASAYGEASRFLYGKSYTPATYARHKAQIEARLVDAGLSKSQASQVVAGASSIRAGETRGSGPMQFIQPKYVIRSAANMGLIAPVNTDGRTISQQLEEPKQKAEPEVEAVDYRGFERIELSSGGFELRDGNMTVRVESIGQGKYQASFRSAKSTPHLRNEQDVVDWAAAIRGESKRTNPAPKKGDDDVLAKIPAGVQSRIKYSLNGLNAIRDRLASVERARGRGYNLSVEWRDAQPEIEKHQANLQEFRRMARDKGIDADAAIRALGGEPDFSGYTMPEGSEPAPTQKEAWHTDIPGQGIPLTGDQLKGKADAYAQVPRLIAADAWDAITQTQRLNQQPMYAYYLPANGARNGIARLFPDDQTPPAPWKLLSGEAMRHASMAKDQGVARLAEWLRSAPVLGDDKAAGEESDAKRESRSEVAQPSDLTNIFAGLSARGLAKTRAQKAADAHPRAEQIAYVQDNFLDILTELEDSGIVKINCD